MKVRTHVYYFLLVIAKEFKYRFIYIFTDKTSCQSRTFPSSISLIAKILHCLIALDLLIPHQKSKLGFYPTLWHAILCMLYAKKFLVLGTALIRAILAPVRIFVLWHQIYAVKVEKFAYFATFKPLLKLKSCNLGS